jgi:hypothetical protein
VSTATCDTCVRLWREYASATNDHIRYESRLKAVTLEQNHEATSMLTREVEALAEARVKARKAIELHEAESHLDGFGTGVGA